MGLMICCYCLNPCGPQGDGCCDKGLSKRNAEEVQTALERHSHRYTAAPTLPEVWLAGEYGDCFFAWGHHPKGAMLDGARIAVEEAGENWDDCSYKEDLEHAAVQHLYAYTEDASDPEDAEYFWTSKLAYTNSKPITRMAW